MEDPMKSITAVAMIALITPSYAQTPKASLTVEQCINILGGLNSLNWKGQQLNEAPGSKPANAEQYKLGISRFTIALDIAALTPILTSYQRAQQQFAQELPQPPQTEAGKPSPSDAQRILNEDNKKLSNWQFKTMAEPCQVTLSHLKLADLKIGDGTDQNPIPVSVLAALTPIIDQK
jgi:hypothetical protein